MAKSDFQSRYTQPVLGYVWSLLGPLLLAGVLYLAFTRFLRFGGEIQNYPLLLIFDVMIFSYFPQATSRAVPSFVQQQNITRKVEFPLLAVPLSAVVAELRHVLLSTWWSYSGCPGRRGSRSGGLGCCSR